MLTGTVVVRAMHRADVLAQCLLTLDQQLAMPEQLEIVVVHDGTPPVAARLDEWAAAGDRRRTLVASRPGGAAAGGLALAAAGGDVVLFTDATFLLPPTWLRTHLAVHDADPGVGMVGGPVGVHWPVGRPSGIGPEVASRTSGFDLGNDAGPFPDGQQPVRANMSVRRVAADAVGGFDPWLDVGTPEPLAPDTFGLADRLRRAGWVIAYEPGAAAVAQLTPTDLGVGRLRRRAFADGIVRARGELARTGVARTRRIRRSAGELRAAARAWQRRRAEKEPVGSLLPIILHTAASLEFARLVVRRS